MLKLEVIYDDYENKEFICYNFKDIKMTKLNKTKQNINAFKKQYKQSVFWQKAFIMDNLKKKRQNK